MKTLIIVIMDESGSMGPKKNDVIGGFNSFIDDQKNIKNDTARLYLVKFNTTVNFVHSGNQIKLLNSLNNLYDKYCFRDNLVYILLIVILKPKTGVPLENVPELTSATYLPGGGTALFDAIAESVRVAQKDKSQEERVICVIMTDGEENSSRETTKEQVKQIIAGYEAKGDWTFLYIGENPEQWTRDAGMSSGHGVSYNHSAPRANYLRANEAVRRFRQQSERQADNLFDSN